MCAVTHGESATDYGVIYQIFTQSSFVSEYSEKIQINLTEATTLILRIDGTICNNENPKHGREHTPLTEG